MLMNNVFYWLLFRSHFSKMDYSESDLQSFILGFYSILFFKLWMKSIFINTNFMVLSKFCFKWDLYSHSNTPIWPVILSNHITFPIRIFYQSVSSIMCIVLSLTMQEEAISSRFQCTSKGTQNKNMRGSKESGNEA